MALEQIYFKESLDNVDFEKVAQILNDTGLNDSDAAVQQATFEHSDGVLFAYDGPELIACSRVLSDGISQAAIYNVAIAEPYQHSGLGTKMITRLVERYQQCNIILYTHPKTLTWYEELGFERMNTGLAIFQKDHVAWMRQEGFLKQKGSVL